MKLNTNMISLNEVDTPPFDESIDDITSLLGTFDGCKCGKKHTCDIEHVVIRRGALNELPDLTNGYGNILLVCDENTRPALRAEF